MPHVTGSHSWDFDFCLAVDVQSKFPKCNCLSDVVSSDLLFTSKSNVLGIVIETTARFEVIIFCKPLFLKMIQTALQSLWYLPTTELCTQNARGRTSRFFSRFRFQEPLRRVLGRVLGRVLFTNIRKSEEAGVRSYQQQRLRVISGVVNFVTPDNLWILIKSYRLPIK